MTAWYNEPDPGKAAWLRELIKAGVIAPGDVDERSIVDVKPSDLVGYTQCHFFAGIGVWSYALRQADWPDDRPVWTGSCPCPSFSQAGKGEGFDDDRHLWPVWDTIIGECRPPVIFGEQSHAAIGFGWLDLVCGNLEAKNYAVAAAVLGAHSVGAPHRRQRLYFCADTKMSERGRSAGKTYGGRRTAKTGGPSASSNRPNADGRHSSAEREQRGGKQRLLTQGCATGIDHNPFGNGRRARRDDDRSDERSIADAESEFSDSGDTAQRGFPMRGGAPGITGHAAQPSKSGVDIDAKCAGLEGHFWDVREWRGPGWLDPHEARSVAEAGATRGFWADCDWWYGRDGKYRPIGPGIQPLAAGAAARVLRLRGYGDSIVAPCAQVFIQAYLDTLK